MNNNTNSNKSDLGVAIIVKDASKTIERAIKSVLPICRQLVVVDTGSLDSTPAICKRNGAELHFHKWQDNFSEARNYGLRFMHTEWVLVIDADEELLTNSFIRNFNLFENPSIGGIKVKLTNFLGNEPDSAKSAHTYTRIFRNNPKIRFSGSIHEQIAESIESAGYDIIPSDIEIIHYGYSEHSDEKIERNRKLLKKELEQNENDAWLMFHLAETEFTDGHNQIAKDNYLKILESADVIPQHYEKSRIRLAQIFLSEGSYESVGKYADFICSDLQLEGLRKYVLAASMLFRNEFEKAKELYCSKEVSASELVPKKDILKALELIETIEKSKLMKI